MPHLGQWTVEFIAAPFEWGDEKLLNYNQIQLHLYPTFLDRAGQCMLWQPRLGDQPSLEFGVGMGAETKFRHMRILIEKLLEGLPSR